jgi:ribA/ribD-fused uncharacterized protein
MTDKREREEFDKWLALPVAAGDDPAPWIDSLACDAAWQAWQARAALAAHDAEPWAAPVEPTVEPAQPEVLRQIQQHLNVMMGNATPNFDGGNDGDVTGYHIRTGALHRILGLMSGVGLPINVPIPYGLRNGVCCRHTAKCRDADCLYASRSAEPAPAPADERQALPHPGSPEASAMIDSKLAEYGWPANKKGAARAGYEAARELARASPAAEPKLTEHHGLDNDRQVFFYEQDFYVLSNFSAFTLYWRGLRFDTSEAAYHFEKFSYRCDDDQANDILFALRDRILKAPSAHEAFKIAEKNKALRRHDWDDVKVGIMREILRAKAGQHEYVRRKLLATGDRELIENSWRDDYWGWGPNRDGQNMLGKLWMEVRAELREAASRGKP